MSVDALLQVFRDHSDVSPGVQAVLIALAWRTPKDRDATVPTSYADIAGLTRQHKSTARRNVLEAISVGAAEVVWARRGEKSRYRVNRGEWHISASPGDLEKALWIMQEAGLGYAHDAHTTDFTTPLGGGHGDDTLRISREEEGRQASIDEYQAEVRRLQNEKKSVR